VYNQNQQLYVLRSKISHAPSYLCAQPTFYALITFCTLGHDIIFLKYVQFKSWINNGAFFKIKKMVTFSKCKLH
jgi:hypothetical protein